MSGPSQSSPDSPNSPILDPTLIAIVLDRSGSMSGLRDDTIGGYNTFLGDQQKEPGEAMLLRVLFDHEYGPIEGPLPIKDAKALDTSSYVPRGDTALLDAIGRTISDIDGRLAAIPTDMVKPRVLVVIITDGQENNSKEFTKPRVLEMITERRNTGWEFRFLSADEGGIADAQAIGIPQIHIHLSGRGRAGVEESFATSSVATSNFRRGGSSGNSGQVN